LRFRFNPRASRDLARLYAFLEPVDPAAAARAVRTILLGIRSLVQFSDRGRPVPGNARELIIPFGSGKYIVSLSSLPPEGSHCSPPHLALAREPRLTCAHMPAPIGP